MSALIVLSGSLKTGAGVAVPSTAISLTEDGNAIGSYTTGADGTYKTGDLIVPVGDHSFTAASSGTNAATAALALGIRIISGTVSAEVATGETVTVTITDPSGKQLVDTTATVTGGAWTYAYLALVKGAYSVAAAMAADSKYAATSKTGVPFSF